MLFFVHFDTRGTRFRDFAICTASLHTLHMSKPNVTRVQSATQSTSSVHTLHMPKPNVTRVQSATQSTASVHTLHMPKNLLQNCFASSPRWCVTFQTCQLLKSTSSRRHTAGSWTWARSWPWRSCPSKPTSLKNSPQKTSVPHKLMLLMKTRSRRKTLTCQPYRRCSAAAETPWVQAVDFRDLILGSRKVDLLAHGSDLKFFERLAN